MKLVLYPDPILREVAEPIKSLDPMLRAHIIHANAIRKEHRGIGIAANQVGLRKRFVWIDNVLMINPKIIKHSPARTYGEEGCLSLPGKTYFVPRLDYIGVVYQDIHLNEQSTIASGMWARVIQHEIDHLDGILLLDKEKDEG